MLREPVRVVLGDQQIIQCEELTLSSDLYDPTGKWSLDLGQRVTAKPFARCEVFINGIRELTGIVDRVEETKTKSSHTWRVEGVSLVGLLARSSLTSWTNPPNTLAAAAKKLLSTVPMVKELPWEIQGDDPAKEHARFDVGDSVFSVLNEFAQNRGLLFWAKPNGSIVFGKAAGKGDPKFSLNSSSIESRQRVEDSSNLHSEIHIVSDSDEDGHRLVVARNPSVALHLPFAAAYNGHDAGGLEKQASQYLRQEKLQAEQLTYTVRGFSQGGVNWAINERIQVDDAEIGLRDTLLVRSRSFKFNRKTGSTTDLVLTPILAEDVFKAYPKRKKKEADAW